MSEAIKEARQMKELTQDEVARMGYISNKTLSAIECGRRNIAPDVLKEITQGLEYPRLYIEAADEVTGGVFGVPWLNGEVDLHRAAVKEKVLEEMDEAIEAIKSVRLSISPRACKAEQYEKAEESIQEAIDVYVAAAHYIAIISSEFGFDVKEEFSKHRQKLIKNGYLKRVTHCR